MVSRYDRRAAFEQVADALRDRIARGEYEPGSQLPSYTQLESEYGVAITTAQRAIRTLKAEGLIEGQRGKGNFVRRERPVVTIPASYIAPADGKWHGWRATARLHGMDGSQTLDEVTEGDPPTPVADALRLEDGELVVVRRRTMYLDGKPVQLADSYYAAELARGTLLARNEKIPRGTPALLDEMGYKTAECEEFVTARMPTTGEAEALKLGPGVPVIEMVRVTKAENDVPVQCEVFVLAADRHRLKYVLPNC
ncbi:GntR family transcriptional regulator [Streptomyces sp. NBC_00433]